MKVSFFDLRRIYLEQKEEIDKIINKVLDFGQYILGPECSTFEQNLKKELIGNGPGEVVTCNSGTDALVLSLLTAGVGKGDDVITVSHTAIPTISAIIEVGAQPIFIDIDPKNWLMDLEKISAAITAQTKAIIAVHLYGNVLPVLVLERILKEMGRLDISIIEDVAQAQGSSIHSQNAGTWGRFGAFSFYPTKNLGGLGDGGAVFCKSEADASKLRMLRNYGKSGPKVAEISRGLNSRMDEIQAAVLNTRLKLMADWKRRKTLMMKRYREELDGLPIEFQEITPNCDPSWHLCVISLESESERNQLREFYSKHEIQTLIHYLTPTHLQAAFASKKTKSLPNTENVAKRIISLPMNPALREDEQAHVIKVTRSFF